MTTNCHAKTPGSTKNTASTKGAELDTDPKASQKKDISDFHKQKI